MAKRKRENRPELYAKWIKEGYGQGIGKEYKPWLTNQDVPSKGRATRLHGIKTDRQHDVFSDKEKKYMYILEYADCVKDIREQYPLFTLEQTMAIADELGIEHPKDPVTGENIIMTTDFLITIEKNGQLLQLARTLKSPEELDNYRQIEKFEIERRYWHVKGIDWGIVTENEIDDTFASNIGNVRSFWKLDDISYFENLSAGHIKKLINTFKTMLMGQEINVREVANDFDDRMMLVPGTSISLFKHLIITKQIEIDLFKKLNIDSPMAIYSKDVDATIQGVESV